MSGGQGRRIEDSGSSRGQPAALRAPYATDPATTTASLSQSVIDAPWLSPREVAEAPPWPLLHIGGNHACPTPSHIVEAAVQAAAKPPYPSTLGLSELRVAIAERLTNELGYEVDPERNVLVTCGSMQGLYLAFAVAANRGERVVAHAPSFLYADLATICGVRLEWAHWTSDVPDWSVFAQALTPETRLAIVNTPCNPTGYVFTEEDIEALTRAAHGRDLWLLSDEAMMAHVYDGRRHLSPALSPDLRSRTVLVRSFSKMYSMGPWRVGFAVGPESIISAMAKLLQWSIIGVDSVAQAAALAAMTGPQEWMQEVVAELSQTRLRAVDALNKSRSLRAAVPHAGTVLWARLPEDADEREASRLLGRRYGIPAVAGRHFGATRPHLRLPFGGEMEDVELFLNRLPLVDIER